MNRNAAFQKKIHQWLLTFYFIFILFPPFSLFRFPSSPSLLSPTCVSSPSFLPSTCVALQKFCLECKYFDFMYLVLCKLFVVDGVICKFYLLISENLKWDFDSIFYVWVNESMSIFYEWMSQVSVNKVNCWPCVKWVLIPTNMQGKKMVPSVGVNEYLFCKEHKSEWVKSVLTISWSFI